MNKKYLYITITFFALLLIILAIVLIIISSKKEVQITTGFDITVVPSDSQIYIDDIKVKIGINKTTVGNHNLTINHKDFSTYKSTITATKDKIATILIGLEPANDAGKKWVTDNEAEYVRLDGLASKKFENNVSKVANDYPIITALPIDMSPLYKIGQGISKKNPSELSVAIYIASNNPTDKLSALQEIYNLGYDPSDYEIIFEGL